MTKIAYDQSRVADTTPFDELIGEDFVSFIFDNAPRKVRTRVEKALDHASKATKLEGADEEMGVIRLIAAEEELVVAIFEWLKLNAALYPVHRDFVGKFKNHVVKLSFYPVLLQFRLILGGMIEEGLTLIGLEDVISWNAKPVIDQSTIRIAIIDENGKELLRHDPLHIDITQGDIRGKAIVPSLVKGLTDLVQNQHSQGLKEFLIERADYRNKLLYASDGGSIVMGETLEELMPKFRQTYHDLLWVLLVLIGGRPLRKEWGIVSQFIELYRQVLIIAGVIKQDGTVVIPA